MIFGRLGEESREWATIGKTDKRCLALTCKSMLMTGAAEVGIVYLKAGALPDFGFKKHSALLDETGSETERGTLLRRLVKDFNKGMRKRERSRFCLVCVMLCPTKLQVWEKKFEVEAQRASKFEADDDLEASEGDDKMPICGSDRFSDIRKSGQYRLWMMMFADLGQWPDVCPMCSVKISRHIAPNKREERRKTPHRGPLRSFQATVYDLTCTQNLCGRWVSGISDRPSAP